MTKQNWGRIISIASVQALTPKSEMGAYAAAKGAIIIRAAINNCAS
jgi:short-subunit dehydrogenase